MPFLLFNQLGQLDKKISKKLYFYNMTKDKKKAILKYLYNEKHRTLVNGISIHNVIKDWKIVDIKHTLCSLKKIN